MKTLQERFEENYAAVERPANNKDGFKIEYVYYAQWYIWDLPEKELKKCKLTLLAVSVIGLLFYIYGGTRQCEANSALWVGVPALVGLCGHVFELFGLIMFTFAKYRTTKMTYTDVNRMLTLGPVLRTGTMVVTVTASIVYLFLLGFDWNAMIALLSFMISGITSVYVSKTYRSLNLRTERNDTLEKLEAQGRLH